MRKLFILFYASLLITSCSTQEDENYAQLSVLKKGELVMKLLQDHQVELEELCGVNFLKLNEVEKKQLLGNANLDSIYSLIQWVDEINNTTWKTSDDINYIPLTRSSTTITIKGKSDETSRTLSMELGYGSNLYVLKSSASGTGIDSWSQKDSKSSSFTNNSAKVGAKGKVSHSYGSTTFYMTGYVEKNGSDLTNGLIEHFRSGSSYWDDI